MTPDFSEPLTLELVLRRVPKANITNRWCQRLADTCDGHITLGEAFRRLYLPVVTGQRIAALALQEGWLQPVDMASPAPVQRASVLLKNFRRDLVAVLQQHEALDSSALIERASDMIRLDKERLSLEDISSFLLAVELLLPEEPRARLLPLLDALRGRYGA